jgi:hypothetical protein
MMGVVPSENNFRQIAADPQASVGRSYLWVFIASLIGGLISGVIGLLIGLVFGGTTTGNLGASAITRLCVGPVFSGIAGVIGISISAGIIQLVAGALGGKGSLGKLLIAFSSFFVPFVLIDSIIAAIPILNLILLPLVFLYIAILNVTATKAVNELSWGRAVVAVVVVPIGLGILVGCLVGVALVLLGPALGGVFSNIVQQI